MFKLDAFLRVAVPPEVPDAAWLQGAPSAVDYIRDQRGANTMMLFANAGQALVHTVLVPLANVTPEMDEGLQHATIDPYGHWRLEHVSGGGEPDRMHLSPPIDGFGAEALEGGEQLVFRRHFTGVDKGAPRTELSQPLVQALDLYWMEEESGYCRLNRAGDVEPVIRVRDLRRETGETGAALVTIEAGELHRYMAVTETALVMKFDFTRYPPNTFWSGFHDQIHRQVKEADLLYHTGVQADASYASGVAVMRPALTREALIAKANRAERGLDRRYATFKAHDWRNGRHAEISCAPEALASYFDEGSSAPFQTSPAFFRPDVLMKYKADPEKYRLEHRSIHSRAGWSLRSYDVNDAGQVHAYLDDLAKLPFDEQLYWQSFNEWAKGPISKRAFESDFEGSFSAEPDPLGELKLEISKLDKLGPDYWHPRGPDLSATVHYPVTASSEEWSNAILALDQLVVEGFVPKALRARLALAGITFDGQWGSLKLLREVLAAAGVVGDEVETVTAPLRELHHLRSKVKGHSATAERAAIIKAAKAEHGSLPSHFRSLVGRVRDAFDRLVEVL